VERAHDLRLKVLVDLVPNHTSDQHPWFRSALSSLDDPHRFWYHFADSKPDGSPPNNWTSAFGGPAWARDEASGQWYMHLFAPEQPDLNWWNPEVQAEFEKIVRFWLERGADGFRIDVAPALFKRPDLADRPMIRNRATGTLEPDPAFSIFDQPQLHDVYKKWREIASELTPERVLVGEIFEPRRHSAFVAPDQLNMAFALITVPWDAARWRRLIDVDRGALKGPGSEPSWTLSNHDVVREVTRFGGGILGRKRALAAMLLVLGLPGQVFLYQGEELGLEEADVPDEQRQDPVFFHSGGSQKGRDGCRVPMPWLRGRPYAGFSTAPTWLPEPAGWDRFAVDAQLASYGSVLRQYMRTLALRRRLATRLADQLEWCPAPDGVLLFRRGALVVACNFGHRPVELEVEGRLVAASDLLVKKVSGRLKLPPSSAAWLDAWIR
jgi:alpha-glucosidase